MAAGRGKYTFLRLLGTGGTRYQSSLRVAVGRRSEEPPRVFAADPHRHMIGGVHLKRKCHVVRESAGSQFPRRHARLPLNPCFPTGRSA
jgi:hypothetical protein